MKAIGKENLIILGALAGVVVLSVFAVYLPQSSQLDEIEQDITERKNTLQANVDKVAVVPSLLKRVEKLKSCYTGWERRLPKQKELGGFLREISTLLNDHELANQAIEPGSPTRQTLYHQLPIIMRFKGSYLSLATFLQRMDRMQRLTRVEKLVVHHSADDRENLGAEPLDIEVHMNIYFTES